MSCRTTHIEVANRRAVLRPPRNWTEEEKLFERQLALKDISFGQSKASFDIQRRQHLTMQDDVAKIRCIFRQSIDNRIAESFPLFIPAAFFQMIGRVLD